MTPCNGSNWHTLKGPGIHILMGTKFGVHPRPSIDSMYPHILVDDVFIAQLAWQISEEDISIETQHLHGSRHSAYCSVTFRSSQPVISIHGNP